jgi:hypothetical protein
MSDLSRCNTMRFEPNEKTTAFVKEVSDLLNSGAVKNYTEIVNKLKWDKTLMSNVMNGRKNVPNDVYKKFKEVYQPVTIENLEKLAIETSLQNQAYIRVILQALAEVLSRQRGESYAKTLSDLEVAAAGAEKLLLDRLRQIFSS